MKTIVRTQYQDRMMELNGTPDIKIITGLNWQSIVCIPRGNPVLYNGFQRIFVERGFGNTLYWTIHGDPCVPFQFSGVLSVLQ